MKEKRDFTAEELLEHFNKDNRMNLSFSDAQELSGNVTEQDFEDFLKDSNNPIGEYEGLTKKMRVKIQEIISSLKLLNEKISLTLLSQPFFMNFSTVCSENPSMLRACLLTKCVNFLTFFPAQFEFLQ